MGKRNQLAVHMKSEPEVRGEQSLNKDYHPILQLHYDEKNNMIEKLLVLVARK